MNVNAPLNCSSRILSKVPRDNYSDNTNESIDGNGRRIIPKEVLEKKEIYEKRTRSLSRKVLAIADETDYVVCASVSRANTCSSRRKRQRESNRSVCYFSEIPFISREGRNRRARSFFVSHFAPRNSVPLTHTNTCLTPSRAVQYDWYGRHELNNPRLSRAFPGPLHRRRFRRTVSIRRALKRPRYSISPSHQQRYRECRIAPAFDTAPYRFLQCYFRIDGHAQMHSDYICSRKEEKRSRVCV